MNDSEPFQRASGAALRFLSYRPRSVAEVRARLLRSFPSDVVEQVIEHLVERDLVDDARFADLWRDSRESLNPRSASVIKRELIERGVARDIAEVTVQEVDDQENANRAGMKLARRLEEADFPAFRRKLWSYLQRRGFSGSVARNTTRELWDQLQEDSRRSSADGEGR